MSKGFLHAAGKCLQRLDLSDNPMTGDVAQALAEMLRQHPHLRVLNLNDTSLEDAGISIISQALADSGATAHTVTHANVDFAFDIISRHIASGSSCMHAPMDDICASLVRVFGFRVYVQ